MRNSWTLAAVLGAVQVAAQALPTVDLGYAVQQATINETGQYFNFSNIRYGVAPLGNLRFSAPLPPRGRNRTVNDGQTSVICPQANPGWELITGQFLAGENITSLENETTFSLSNIPPPVPGSSEDCLFLDVMVPEKIFNSQRAKKKRGEIDRCFDCDEHSNGSPVMVWIYGGGFTEGSKTLSGNPAGLIARSQVNGQEGVIFVAMNYRLGLFGWMSGPTFQTTGTANIGLFDQRLALDWVQENIHLFGGDPNRVTVFGESAGGSSIMHQITAFGGLKGKAPFQQAILQSPAFQSMASNLQQENVFNEVLSFASLVSNTTVSSLDQLRQLPTSVLQTVNAIVVGNSSYGTFSFGPTVDGLFAPALPGILLLHGQFDNSVKIMVGHNSDEGLLFTDPFVQNQAEFVDDLRILLPDASDEILDLIDTTLYPPVFNGSFGYTDQIGRTSLAIAEASFTCNTRYLALAFNNQSFSYLFNVPPGLHGEDIAYTYFNGDTSTSDDGSPVNATVAMAFQEYLTSFVMNGTPNEKGVPFFPMYGANSTVLNIAGTDFGEDLVDTVANSRCTFWQKALYY